MSVKPIALTVALAAVLPSPLYGQTQTPCAKPDGGVLELNRIVQISDAVKNGYSIKLSAGQGVIVDLVDPSSLMVMDAATAAAEGAAAAATDAAISAADAAADTSMDAAAAADSMTMADAEVITAEKAIRICRLSDGLQLAPGKADRAFDDTGSEEQNTSDGYRLTFNAPAAQDYIVDIAALLAKRTDTLAVPIEIFVRERPVASNAEVRRLDDSKNASGNKSWTINAPYDGTVFGPIYSFSGSAGQQITLSLIDKNAGKFDPFLRMATPSTQSSIDLVVADDDGAGSPNAKLVRTLTETGLYRVQVGGFGEKSDYELKLSIGEPPQAKTRKLALGRQENGKLEANELFELNIVAGRTYTVSAKFDDNPDSAPAIDVLVENPLRPVTGIFGNEGAHASIASGVTTMESTNAAKFIATAKGKIFVRVLSYDFTMESGGFTISVTESR